jgi:hypothetical protein
MDPMGKDPTSTSCEDLILDVHLPEANSVADIDVHLQEQSIMLQTSVQCVSLKHSEAIYWHTVWFDLATMILNVLTKDA